MALMPFLLLAAGTLVSEDLTCVAAGLLVAQGKLDFWTAAAACLFGIWAGDLLLFAAGRCIGRPLLHFPLARRYLSEARLEQASAWLAERGMKVVFASRFMPGLRLPVYFAAGMLRTRFLAFLGYFLLAAAVWTPLLVGAAAMTGGAAGRLIPAIAVTLAGLSMLKRLQLALWDWRRRRRIFGFLLRKVRWEFWPPWAAYLPLVPWIAWLALRYRSLTLFTAANPGIPTGGFAGESKSGILTRLSGQPGLVPAFQTIRAGVPPAARVRQALEFMESNGLDYPVVLKPDKGARGAGVAVIRSREELESRLCRAPDDCILQEYVPGLEFGVFYYRYPGERAGRISSLTEKRFPEVLGDGRSTVEDLILRDQRAVCLAELYLQRSRRAANDIPAAGERVAIAEIGSHCRGAAFVDAGRLWTGQLEQLIDRIAKAHPGFFFGRFDIRAPSIDDLRSGRNLRVLELNGVTSEPTHVYDPAVSLREAYRTMMLHWRIAFEIGALNRARGIRPAGVRELLRALRASGEAVPSTPANDAPAVAEGSPRGAA